MHETFKGNLVPLFVKMIAELGGEYVPFVDGTPAKAHTSGRRETRIEPRSVGMPDYFTDHHGSLRRLQVKIRA